MKTRFKKVLSVFLSVLLIAFCFPFSAFAETVGNIYGKFVDDATGNPVVGLAVRLETEDHETVVGTSVTDADGRFEFNGVSSSGGFYRVVLDESGSHYPSSDDDYNEDDTYGYIAAVLTAGDNTFLKGVDTVELTLKKGNVVLTKVSSGTTTVVEGAEYELYTAAGTLICSDTTDALGQIKVSDLPYGDYKFKEISSPDEYFVNSDEITFEIRNNGETVNVTAEDEHKGSFTLVKTDADSGIAVPNTTFRLYDDSDVLIGEYVTDADGKINVGYLHLGDYYYVETKAAENYIIDETQHNFNLSGSGFAFTANVTNTHYPEVTINKLSSYDDSALAGATLEIYKGDVLVDSFTTTAGSYQTFLEPGDYTLKEAVTPAGYNKADDIDFTVELGAENTITMYDEPIIFELNKYYESATGSISHNGLKYTQLPAEDTGVSFTLEGPATYTFAPGEAAYEIVAIPAGEYTLTETNVNNPYEKSNVINVTIEETADKQSYKVYNNLKTVKVDFRKVNEDNDVLVGSAFAMSSVWNTNETVDTASGSVEKVLKPGTYNLVETVVPDGYLKCNDIELVISDDLAVTATNAVVGTIEGDVIPVYITNQSTKVLLYKVDSENSNSLSGATIKIVSEDNLYEKEFDINGAPIQINGELKPGNYTVSETVTPYGYETITPFTFTVEPISSVQVLTVRDNRLTAAITVLKDGTIADSVTVAERIEGFIETVFEFITGRLSDTQFSLYAIEDVVHPDGVTGVIYAAGELVSEKTTDVSGMVTFDNLPFGHYKAVETKAKDGYIIDTVEKDVVLNESNGCISPVELTYNNDIRSISLSVTKTDERGNKIEGAIYGVFTKQHILLNSGLDVVDDVLVGTMVTDENGYAELSIKLPFAEYYVQEIVAPEGYTLSENIFSFNFTVDSVGETPTDTVVKYSFEDVDKAIVLNVAKVDQDGEFVPGATLQLINTLDNSVYAEWISEESSKEFYAIPAGNYIIKEAETPAGYKPQDRDTLVTVSEASDTQYVSVINERLYSNIIINKCELNDSADKPLAGVKYKVINAVTGEVLGVYTTDAYGKISIENIPVAVYEGNVAVQNASYIITEEEALPGYIKDTAEHIVTFGTVAGEDPTYYPADTNIVTINLYNDYTKLEISKLDITTKEELPGASLEIYKASDFDDAGVLIDGAEPYESWISEDTAHYIERIPMGDYVLVETSAPEGYVKAESVKFTVAETGDIQAVTMEDDYTKLEIKKIDKVSQDALPGVVFELYRVDGDATPNDATKYAEWTTDGNSKVFSRIPVGKYLLVEKSAPDGYVVSTEPVEVVIEEVAETKVVTVENDFTKVEILKIDDKTEKPVAGAHLALYRFEDVNEDGEPNKDATPTDAWVSDKDAHKLDKLPAGKYVLIETEAPEGYVLGKAAVINVEDTAEVQLFKYSNAQVEMEEIIAEEPDIPDTGVSNIFVSICLILVSLTLIAISIILVRKNNFK